MAALAPLRPGSSTEMLQALLNAVSDGYVYIVNGVIQDVNEPMQLLTGFSSTELIGQCRPFPFWPASAAAHLTALGERLEEQVRGLDFDMELQHRDGRLLPVSVSVRPVTNDRGESIGVVALVRDGRVSNRAQQALLESRRMLFEAQRQAGLGSWLWGFGEHSAQIMESPASGDQHTGWLHWSPEMFRIFGLDPALGAPSGDEFAQMIHPDDRARHGEVMGAALASGGSFAITNRIVLADGSIRHVHATADVDLDSHGEVLVVRGSVQEITERVEREQALAASEERFRLAVVSSPVGLALVGLDGRSQHVNDALCAMLGHSREDLLTRSIRSLAHPEDADLDTPYAIDLIAGTSQSYTVDKRLIRSDGETLWAAVHVAIVRDEDMQPQHFILQILDNTGNRDANATLQREARTDALSGLPNRRAWNEHFPLALSGGRAADRCDVAILDLDYFKAYNDTFGHQAGDTLIADVAAAWQRHLHLHAPDAFLARIGGEEFGLTLTGFSRAEARRITAELLTLVPSGQAASAGLTRVTSSDTARTAMSRADAALYAAKRAGRNQLQVLQTD